MLSVIPAELCSINELAGTGCPRPEEGRRSGHALI